MKLMFVDFINNFEMIYIYLKNMKLAILMIKKVIILILF